MLLRNIRYARNIDLLDRVSLFDCIDLVAVLIEDETDMKFNITKYEYILIS